MNRKLADLLFTAFILVLVAGAVWDARNWEIKARLFPWVIGMPMVVLLVAQLAMIARQPATSQGLAFFDSHGIPPGMAKRRAVEITAWLLGFAAAMWLIGFSIGGTLGTMAYLRVAGKEKWPMIAIFAIVTLAFFWVMKNPLTVPFSDGVIFDAIGFKPPI